VEGGQTGNGRRPPGGEGFRRPAIAGCASQLAAWFDEPIVKPLMVSFRVIMGNEFLSSVTQRSIAEENHAVKAFFFYGSNKTFEMCRQIRRPGKGGERNGVQPAQPCRERPGNAWSLDP
jgi:hypothetical protein